MSDKEHTGKSRHHWRPRQAGLFDPRKPKNAARAADKYRAQNFEVARLLVAGGQLVPGSLLDLWTRAVIAPDPK